MTTFLNIEVLKINLKLFVPDPAPISSLCRLQANGCNV